MSNTNVQLIIRASILLILLIVFLVVGFLIGLSYALFITESSSQSLILLGSFFATFVASVMAEEQNARIKSGVYGLMGGTGAGALAALITKENQLLLIGFAGSAGGALLGWIISIVICAWVHKTETGRAVLTYLSNGFSGLREEMVLNERMKNQFRQLDAIRTWNSFKARTIHMQLTDILKMEKSVTRNGVVKIVVNEWLASVVSMFEFLFRLGGDYLQNYRPRATVIRFEEINGVHIGKHWIFNSGDQRSFNTNKNFGEKSIGYKVLKGEFDSPYYDYMSTANKEGEDRGLNKSDRSFMTILVSHDTILAVDWPSTISMDDNLVKSIGNLFQDEICPAIKTMIDGWYDTPSPENIEIQSKPN